MAAPSYPYSSGSEKFTPSMRLDGWKDVAAYLGKAERTVKRWERNRGLPIHRVPGGAKASVYAYSDELNEWLNSSDSAAHDPAVSAAVDRAGQATLSETDRAAPTALFPESAQSTISPNRRLQWAMAVIGLALTGWALVLVMVSSATGTRLPAMVKAIFAKKGAGTSLGTSPAISDEERKRARDLYLKGRYEWNQRSPDSLNRALDLFTQAIVHDPAYAQAYAGLADTYDLLREYSTMPDRDAFPRAIAAARKAVELDDSLAEAHRALAFAERYGSWDFADAEKQFRRAIELDPNDAQARRWYANAFEVPGRYEQSLEQLNRAQELDPSSNVTLADKGKLLADAGRTQEAIELLKEVERSAPGFSSPHTYLAGISLRLRDYPDFLYEAGMAAETMNDPVQREIVASARAGYARDGGSGLLNSLYAKQKQYYFEDRFMGTFFAQTCVLTGRRQEALEVLDAAYRRHEAEVVAIFSDPGLLALQDEPRYKALAARIHFPMQPPLTPINSARDRDNPHLASLNGLR
jgi:tetratricopeptide (TPR) repeat protein